MKKITAMIMLAIFAAIIASCGSTGPKKKKAPDIALYYMSMEEVRAVPVSQQGKKADYLIYRLKNSKSRKLHNTATYNLFRFGQVLAENKEYKAAKVCYENCFTVGYLSDENKEYVGKLMVGNGIKLLETGEYEKALETYRFIHEHKVDQYVVNDEYRSFLSALAMQKLGENPETGKEVAVQLNRFFPDSEDTAEVSEAVAAVIFKAADTVEKVKKVIMEFPDSQVVKDAKEKLMDIEKQAEEKAIVEIKKVQKDADKAVLKAIKDAADATSKGLEKASKAIDKLLEE